MRHRPRQYPGAYYGRTSALNDTLSERHSGRSVVHAHLVARPDVNTLKLHIGMQACGRMLDLDRARHFECSARNPFAYSWDGTPRMIQHPAECLRIGGAERAKIDATSGGFVVKQQPIVGPPGQPKRNLFPKILSLAFPCQAAQHAAQKPVVPGAITSTTWPEPASAITTAPSPRSVKRSSLLATG